MKKVITSALVAAAAALATAAPAGAATESEVCAALDKVPSMMIVGLVLQDEGLSAEEAGDLLASAVINTCPRHLPLLETFILTYA